MIKKLVTYNIDGLPNTLDLNDLPWLFKPIVWVYKLIKKTTIITINDNTDVAFKNKQISSYLSNLDADIISVQEDFNYHNELINNLYNRYNCGTYTGKFDLSKIFSSMSWFPYPRFKADGMNLFVKTKNITINNEAIIPWKTSNGYISHGNDLLTHKGFRYYTLNINNKYNIDIYVIHMDADFYNPETCPNVSGDIKARKLQFEQLSSYILNKYKENNNKIDGNRPIIIMGDTNSYDKYEWDVENIKYFINTINSNKKLHCNEVKSNNFKDCDRMFIINNDYSKHKIIDIDCYFDINVNYSDHKPLITKIEII